MFLKKIFSFLDLKDIRIRICLTHIANNFRYRQNQKPNIIEFQYLMSLCQDEKNCIFYRRILTGDSLLDGWQLPPYPGYPVGWLKYFSKLYFTHFLVELMILWIFWIWVGWSGLPHEWRGGSCHHHELGSQGQMRQLK